jgi:hypothetical protein
MLVFLDFEASSLAKDSYPIEVGWIFEDGTAASFLIKPAPDWTDWSSESEEIHGISRSMLENEGMSVEAVANEMLSSLAGHELYASAPSWDGKWMSVLLRRAGHPRHALRLKDSEEAFTIAARQVLGSSADEPLISSIVAESMLAKERGPATHRALADARAEYACWLRVRSTALLRAKSGDH